MSAARVFESRLSMLDKVVYHAKLGSQGERVEHVRAIAKAIAAMHWLDANTLADQVDKAAELAKADLLTDMVGEFPELQGVMGRYYALNDGEDPALAQALTEQYLPRQAGDALAQGKVGIALALADRLDATGRACLRASLDDFHPPGHQQRERAVPVTPAE